MIRHAIIQAGGQGTRLRPLTFEMPKPLITVQDTPIATWLVRLFAKHGVTQITLVHPTKWTKKFTDWKRDVEALGLPVTILLREEGEPLGTMGMLVHGMELGDDPIFVTNGDELKGLNLDALTSFHALHRPAATVALVRVPNPSEYGVAEMDGHRIARFHEKPAIPPSTLISSGLYVVEPSALREMMGEKKCLMFEKDLFPRLAEQGRLGGCVLDGPWYDCGTMERWERAINEWPGLS
jgi:mannose-1-phosphate guanylyltransferase / phosphomannomutase